MSRSEQSAARWLLGVAGAAVTWAALVWATGGFRVSLAGLRLSSSDPVRPLVLAVVCAAFCAWRWPMRFRTALAAIAGAPARHARVVTAAGAAAVGLVTAVFGSTVAAGADSYGYVSEAAMWRHGQLIASIDLIRQAPWPHAAWTFAALGFRPAASQADAIVPTYAPGLPLLMAAFQTVGGYSAAFLVVPLSAAITIWLSYRLAMRLFDASRTALAAALLVGSSPVFLMQGMSPMSDVPVAAAWTGALVLALAERPMLAGLAAGVSLAIRPNLLLLPGSLALWWLARLVAGPSRAVTWSGRFVPALRFCAGVLPAMALVAFVNRALYGSPFASGYGSSADLYAWTVWSTNVTHYGGWLIETQTPVVLLAALFLVVPSWSDPARAPFPRLLLGGTVAATVLSYLFYFAFSDWWYLRFLLPMWPAMMVLLAAGIDGLFRRWLPRVRAAGCSLVILLLIVSGLRVAAARYAFSIGGGERRYVDVARFVDARTEPSAVIICMQHSGSIRQYAGRLTLRIDWLDEAWLDRAVAFLEASGHHPYVLLENWEIDQFQRRFGAGNRLGRLDWLPVAVLRGWNDVALYDAANPGAMTTPVAMPAVSVQRTVSWPVDPPHPAAIPFP